MKSYRRAFGIAAAVGSVLLLAPAAGWEACSEEARRYYEKGTQVSQKYTAQGQPCLEECLEEKRYFYQQAVELCPSYPEAHINLGDVLEKLGRYPEALTHYTRAVELTPDFAIAHFGLGDFYLDTGDYARAVAAYDKGLGIDPDNSLAQERRRQALCLKDKEIPPRECIEQRFAGEGLIKMGPRDRLKDDIRIHIPVPFAYNSDELLSEARKPLQELGAALKNLLESHASAAFLIEGHTDLRGTEEYNLDLSTRRAQRVVQSLVANFSLPMDRLGIKGFGKTRPVTLGSTEADHARNRRVEVVRLEAKELSWYSSIKPVGSPPAKEPSSLAVDVGVFYEDAESRPRKLEEGAVLRSGDGYRIFFETHQPCYVYIFQIDSSGKLFHLYPNPDYGTHDNSVRARAAYWVPRMDKWLELDDTRGKETIYVVATKERREDIEDIFTRYTRSDHAGPKQKLELVLKTMGVLPEPRPGKDVKVASTTGRTVELTTDQLRQKGAGFAYKFAFRHE